MPIENDSVVQANEHAPEGMAGTLLIVEEARPDLLLCYMRLPYKGEAYYRLLPYQVDYIGRAALVVPPNEYDGEDASA